MTRIHVVLDDADKERFRRQAQREGRVEAVRPPRGVIFVDTNVFMYAVGRAHPLRDEARAFFRESLQRGAPLATSAAVLQELLHAYLPVQRIATLDAALALAEARVGLIWPIERLARALADRHGGLPARDLLHLACCTRREVDAIETFDRALAAAFGGA